MKSNNDRFSCICRYTQLFLKTTMFKPNRVITCLLTETIILLYVYS